MYYRECPSCRNQIGYTLKQSRNSAESKKSLCQSCAGKKLHSERPELGKKISEINLGRKHTEDTKKKMSISQEKKWTDEMRKEFGANMSGEKNHFFGKTHTKETLEKIKQTRAENPYIPTDETKQKISLSSKGKNNPMYGKTFYDAWVAKYGIEEADKKLIAYKENASKRTKGKNNPMYGKPSPQGSGNGWSGWYKGWFFRSLMELSYMINEIEKNNLEWKSVETWDFKIIYEDENGVERNYFADFLIGNRLIEIKPQKLQNTVRNSLKRKAAEEYCKQHSLIYEVMDYEKISFDKMKKLVESNEVIFTSKYQQKFTERNDDNDNK